MTKTVAIVDAPVECVSSCARRTPCSTKWLNSSAGELRALQFEDCTAIAFLGSQVDCDLVDQAVARQRPILVSSLAAVSHRDIDFTKVEIGNSLATLPSRRLVLEQLKSGKLGEPGMIRIHRWMHGTNFSVTDKTHRSKLFEEIELVLRCYQEAPTDLVALPVANQRGVVVHMRFGEGRTAIVDFSCSESDADYASFSLIGSTGSANCDDHNNMQLVAKSGTIQAIPARETASELANMVLDFLNRRVINDHTATQASISIGAQRSKQSFEILARIEQSLAAGQAVAM